MLPNRAKNLIKALKDVMTFDAFENGLKQFPEAPNQATKMKYSGKMALL